MHKENASSELTDSSTAILAGDRNPSERFGSIHIGNVHKPRKSQLGKRSQVAEFGDSLVQNAASSSEVEFPRMVVLVDVLQVELVSLKICSCELSAFSSLLSELPSSFGGASTPHGVVYDIFDISSTQLLPPWLVVAAVVVVGSTQRSAPEEDEFSNKVDQQSKGQSSGPPNGQTKRQDMETRRAP